MNKRLLYAASGVFVSLAIVGAGYIASADDHGKSQSDQARAIGSTVEVHMMDNGKVLVRGAKVTSVSSSTINAGITWGTGTLNFAVQTDSNTELIRRYGGNSQLSEISAGDFISFMGMLGPNFSLPVVVNASIVKDWSVQKAHAAFNGTVQSVDASAKKFVLKSEERGNVAVFTGTSTQFMKGSASSSTFADVRVGAKVMASGLFNNVSRELEADKVKVNELMALRTTVEGTVQSVASSSLVLKSGDKNYTVNIASDTSVLNALWLHLPFGSVKVGGRARVYGTFHSEMTVVATVLRDVSVR